MDGQRTHTVAPRIRGRFTTLSVAVVLALAALSGSAGDERPQRRVPDGYRLAFGDEFDGATLDTARWVTTMPWGDVTKGELQHYTSDAIGLSAGRLIITASRADGGVRPYESGTISSRDAFVSAYGYVEMRARVPAGRGLWPALWLVPAEPSSEDEIDILEVLGDDPSRAYMVLHYGPIGQETENQGHYDGPDLSRDFHVFAIDWRPGRIVWYVDGVERHRAEAGVPATPMQLIANLAVGGPDSWPGEPDRSTPFPARYEIDYIRVYQAVSDTSRTSDSNGESSSAGHQ